MKIILSTIALLLLSMITVTAAQVELTQHFMDSTVVVSDLSGLLYDSQTPSSSSAYDVFEFYNAEPTQPDQAIVAGSMGVCFGIFRATVFDSIKDWKQNFQFQMEPFCNVANECCNVHRGFMRAYNANYVDQFEEDLRDCIENYCSDPSGDDCLVLGGMSQGAAIAAVASLYFADYNPTVIAMGQPGAVEADCSLIDSDRHYRFIGALPDDKESSSSIVYDVAPFTNGQKLGAFWYGHTFVASSDETGFAYLGLDNQGIDLSPKGFGATHLASLFNVRSIARYYKENDGTYPVRITGYTEGSPCSIDEECHSKTCAPNRIRGSKQYCQAA